MAQSLAPAGAVLSLMRITGKFQGFFYREPFIPGFNFHRKTFPRDQLAYYKLGYLFTSMLAFIPFP